MEVYWVRFGGGQSIRGNFLRFFRFLTVQPGGVEWQHERK